MVIGDSVVLGRQTAGVTQTLPLSLRWCEEARCALARRAILPPDLGEIRWTGTETGGTNTAFHHTLYCGSHAVSGRQATHVVNGTAGAPQISSILAASTKPWPTDIFLALGHNDVGVGGRTVAQAIADLTTLASQIAAIDASIVIHPVFPIPSVVIGYPLVSDLRDALVASGIPGATGTPWDQWTGFGSAHVIDPATDGHPSAPTGETTASTWSTIDPATVGTALLGLRLFQALYPGVTLPRLAGETWTIV